MSNRTPIQIISYTIVLLVVILVLVIVLLSTNILRILLSNSLVAPIIITMFFSSVATLIIGAVMFFLDNKKKDGQNWFYTREQTIEEVLRLEQQASELEKQRAELEKKQQSLIWQIEAAELARQDPRLAIVIAYQGIETELQRVVNLRYPRDISEELDRQEPRVFHNTSLLEEYIGPESVETIKQIHNLRNRIVHGEVQPEEVSEERAAEYVQRAISLARIILSLG